MIQSASFLQHHDDQALFNIWSRMWGELMIRNRFFDSMLGQEVRPASLLDLGLETHPCVRKNTLANALI